jgi:hypothetical protein
MVHIQNVERQNVEYQNADNYFYCISSSVTKLDVRVGFGLSLRVRLGVRLGLS